MTRFVEVPDSDCEVLERVRDMLKQVRESGGTPETCFAGVTSNLGHILSRGEKCYATCQLENPRQAQVVLDMLEEVGFQVPLAAARGTVVYITRR